MQTDRLTDSCIAVRAKAAMTWYYLDPDLDQAGTAGRTAFMGKQWAASATTV
jgi:hypothetical protein